MIIIDTHLHLWDANTYYRLHNDWLEDYPRLKRSFLPSELKNEFDEADVQYGIVIEAGRDSHSLNQWLLQVASDNSFLVGVMAGIWLQNDSKYDWMNQYCESPKFLGVRTHPPGDSEQWIENTELGKFLGWLSHKDLVLELLIDHKMCRAVSLLAKMYPNLTIVIDHCCLPPSQKAEREVWKKSLLSLAHCLNVFVKFSTHKMSPIEDDFEQRFKPILSYLIDTFGTQRMMWGSNYPVEIPQGSYTQIINKFQKLTHSLSQTEKASLFEITAKQVYRLSRLNQY